MSTYVIGDLQGCLDELQQLLELIAFDTSKDELWLAGDLVNRGPKSLETLRFVKTLGEHVKVVLGNHDMHLLAVITGNSKHYFAGSLDDILHAPDKIDLFEWLRHRPFLHHDSTINWTMIHAGLPPQWSLLDAIEHAKTLESVVQSEQYNAYFANMYGNKPNIWSDDLEGMERLRFITNCFTRLRCCDSNGTLLHKEKLAPKDVSAGAIPWYLAPNRQTIHDRIAFGHWSTLNYNWENNALCTDTGCLWGGTLTAIKLDDTLTRVQLDCPSYMATPE
jgi:bis(5'-nucleosyl)-tetraphosphatase (symmetrical)